MIKRYVDFLAEQESGIDWMAIEKACAEAKALPDCVPSNVREWDVFIRQYERAVDLAEGRWEPHYDWETEEEFNEAVNEQFYLGRGYKKSVYECWRDIFWKPQVLNQTKYQHVAMQLVKLNWPAIKDAMFFTVTKITINVYGAIDRKLPKKLRGDFIIEMQSQCVSLEGSPEWVGGSFYCQAVNLESLKGSPEYVAGNFYCNSNKLTSLEGSPRHVGGNFDCSGNMLKSLAGAPLCPSGIDRCRFH